MNMMSNQTEKFQTFIQKEDVTILVVDSGLGGMAICADIARRLPKLGHFKTVSLIYFNAWPEQNRGYNRLESRKEQIDTFDRALSSMLRYRPDFIMLACNTLSVLYPSTKCYKNARVPFIDIIDFGVDMVVEAIQTYDDRQVVILGTVTTIASRVHYNQLTQLGIPAEKIVLQPCDQLATAIENDPDSTLVSDMIHAFLGEAVHNIASSTRKVYGALCCTHFGYCQDRFQEKLANLTGISAAILNPNRHMADYLLMACKDREYDTGEHIKVVSKIKWESAKISAISEKIRPVSSQTAQSLCNYEHIPDLF